MKALLFAFLAALLLPVPAPARELPPLRIVTPAYTLTCAAQATTHGALTLVCRPQRTPRAAAAAFGTWRYGDPMPQAIFTQLAPIGNGGPTLCDGSTLVCANGVVQLNTGGALAASSALCTNGSSQITTTGCAVGGDTITSPGSSLTVGGTSSATTLDLNLAHANTYTATQSNTTTNALIGTNASGTDPPCSGTNFPAGFSGTCYGGNAGSTTGIVLGPASVGFGCTATCTLGDSRRIQFYESLAGGATNLCDLYGNRSWATLYAACNFKAAGAFLEAGGSNSNGGTCTELGTTSCTVTVHNFNTPICVTGNNTATSAVKWAFSAGTVTLSTATDTADILSVWCWGVF